MARLWGCTVREAQERCSSIEFAEWMAFDQVEPWGNPWEMFAMVTAKIHNANFTKKMGAEEFLPGIKPPEPEQDVEAAILRLSGNKG